MTQGKFMLLIVLYVGLVVAVGEIIYRYDYRRLKRDYNLSDYGARELADRSNCYGCSFAMLLVLLTIIAAVWVIITKWNIPL